MDVGVMLENLFFLLSSSYILLVGLAGLDEATSNGQKQQISQMRMKLSLMFRLQLVLCHQGFYGRYLLGMN
jgi:hypothetical protein